MLNKVAKIAIPDDVLDMSGATEDVETTVDITSYLPDGTSLVLAKRRKSGGQSKSRADHNKNLRGGCICVYA